MSFIIRSFNPSETEYDAVVRLYSAVWPDEKHFSADMWRHNDEEWPDTSLNQRFIAELDGTVAAMCSCYERYWQHQPGAVHIDFHMHPHYYVQGIADKLFEIVLQFLRQREQYPKLLISDAREDRAEQMAFLKQQGFEAAMRHPRLLLQITEFDAAPFHGLTERLQTQSIVVNTLAQLRFSDPDWKEKLYELRWAIIQDVPGDETPTQPTMSEFEQMILEDPALDEQAWFIACDHSRPDIAGNGYWAGMSNLWLNDPARRRLDAGLTGVRRDYRRRGIALALKLRTVEFAQQIGAETIMTSNEENNPMVGLNLQLGFKPRAAWVSLHRAFN